MTPGIQEIDGRVIIELVSWDAAAESLQLGPREKMVLNGAVLAQSGNRAVLWATPRVRRLLRLPRDKGL